ncbi:MAG: UDP-N-acetylglucosamine--N-acetylmuramyl-(pentapeptide) pyrophosphoryl-undecaprenol N-acetylglucosamine transferase [Patescibacteria group bacterium]|jgi:UDP-N-acetylglucosamine--N-acetylmuramyl-(pentapeptide) pyrophosphoryl-undecaprenol N-acetylglucosamine transferase
MENNQTTKTIVFSGGGTGGSVAPLLAVAEEMHRGGGASDLRFVFVGTKDGLEREMVAAFNKEVGAMEFVPLISGKWRRYFSIHNFLDIFKVIAAWFQSFIILKKINPDIVISAGAFVSVPLVWAAAAQKIPILVHQQDLRPGLANRLMAPWARAITVVFEKSLIDYGPRTILAGNPIRQPVSAQDESLAKELQAEYSLDNSIPLILIIGGGTGATGINRLIFKAAPELVHDCQIIHLTGRGKLPEDASLLSIKNYHVLEFLDNRVVSALMSMSNLVVSRAGLGALTELSYWRKPALLIPMPRSHQEDNAAYFAKAQAALFLYQSELSPEKLALEIRNILNDPVRLKNLGNNIGKIMKRDAADTISGIIWEIISGRE